MEERQPSPGESAGRAAQTYVDSMGLSRATVCFSPRLSRSRNPGVLVNQRDGDWKRTHQLHLGLVGRPEAEIFVGRRLHLLQHKHAAALHEQEPKPVKISLIGTWA